MSKTAQWIKHNNGIKVRKTAVKSATTRVGSPRASAYLFSMLVAQQTLEQEGILCDLTSMREKNKQVTLMQTNNLSLSH